MESVPNVGTKSTLLNGGLLFAESAIVVTFVVANAEKSACGFRTRLEMIIEMITIGMIICLMLVEEDEYVLYNLTKDGLEGITEKEALAQGLPRSTWDKANSDYQDLQNTVDAVIKHINTMELPEATMRLTESDRNINQENIVYNATIIALTDYVKRSSGDIKSYPCDYDGEDFLGEMKQLAKIGLNLKQEDWPEDETHEWWDEVQKHVPKLWI